MRGSRKKIIQAAKFRKSSFPDLFSVKNTRGKGSTVKNESRRGEGSRKLITQNPKEKKPGFIKNLFLRRPQNTQKHIGHVKKIRIKNTKKTLAKRSNNIIVGVQEKQHNKWEYHPRIMTLFKKRYNEPLRPLPKKIPVEIIKELVAGDIMTGKVISIRDLDTLDYVVRLFSEKNISGAPVLNRNGNLVGTLSETDIDQFVGTKGLIDEQVNRLDMLRDIKVADIMKRNIVTVYPSTPIHEVNHLMNKHDIARVFVVNERRQVIGIVTRADVVKGLSKEMLVRIVHKPKEFEKTELATSVDDVLEMVEDKGSVSVTEIQKILDIPETRIEEWGKMLEKHNLIEIVYPPVGKPVFKRRAKQNQR